MRLSNKMDILPALGLVLLCIPGMEELGVLMSCISVAKQRVKNLNLDLGDTFGYWNYRRINDDEGNIRARNKKRVR